MLGIIPGIMLAIFLLMYVPLIVIDGLGPIDAFTESFRLVVGSWWRTFGLLLIILILQLILTAIVDFLTLHSWSLYNVLRIVISILFYPLYCGFFIVVLHDLKLRKALQDKAIEHP
jgi:hypothetical protein